MTTNHLKTGVERTRETSCISNIPQTIGNVQNNVSVMNQPLSQTFTESLAYAIDMEIYWHFLKIEVQFTYKLALLQLS
jgi:hypothetical protein